MADNSLDSLQDFHLDRLVLCRSFNDQVAALEARDVGGGLDSGQGSGLIRLGHAPFFDHAIQRPGNGLEGFVECRLRDVLQDNGIAFGSKGLGNAIAHGARTDHANVFKRHETSSLLFKTIEGQSGPQLGRKRDGPRMTVGRLGQVASVHDLQPEAA